MWRSSRVRWGLVCRECPLRLNLQRQASGAHKTSLWQLRGRSQCLGCRGSQSHFLNDAKRVIVGHSYSQMHHEMASRSVVGIVTA